MFQKKPTKSEPAEIIQSDAPDHENQNPGISGASDNKQKKFTLFKQANKKIRAPSKIDQFILRRSGLSTGKLNLILYIISFVRLLILPIPGVYLLQSLSAYQQRIDNSVFFSAGWRDAIGDRFVWNYLILLIPFLILYALPKFKITSCIFSAVVLLFGFAEHFVILFKNTIIFPWDFSNLPLAIKVSGNYSFAYKPEMLAAVLLFCVMVFLSILGKDPPMRIWIRPIIILLTCTFTYFYFTGFVMSKRAQSEQKITFYYTIVNYNYKNGVLMNFGYHMQFLFPKKPENYSRTDAQNLMNSYQTPAETIEKAADFNPNVIVIMSESFADFRSYGDIETSEPFMPFWDSLSGNNVIKKNLLVSVFGGSTANSEFEMLTGMTMQFFVDGTYPFKQYIRKPVISLAHQFKAEGYDTLAIHPFDPVGWNRNQVLPLLGFDEFISEDAFTDAGTYRTFVSDESSFSYLIDSYENHREQKPETPFFQYLITMQNHGGYKSTDTLPYHITPIIDDHNIGAGKSYPQASQYYSLLRMSDDALKMLIEYFENVNEPTLIVLYGDHLPNLEDGYMDVLNDIAKDKVNRTYLRNETPLLVWANYDISETALAKLDTPLLSLNYLNAYLAEPMGIAENGLQNFLKNMNIAIPAINGSAAADSQYKFYRKSDNSYPEDIQDWLDIYEALQYYQLYENPPG